MESESSKLILSKVPVIPLEDTTVGHIEQMSWIHSDDEINSDLKNRQSKEEFCEKNEQIASCDGSVMTDQILPSFFQAEMMYDNFTFTPLSRHEGKVRVCAETLCCYLNYKKTFPPSELYAFGVFDGLHTVHGNYSLQICAVVKCGGPEPKTCGHEVTDASSVINFELWGMTGSGIYSPLHSSYHYDMESESSKLILSKVPVIPLEDTTVGHIEQMSWIHSDDEINSDLKNRQSKEEFCEKNEQIASCDGSVMTDQILPSFFQAEMMYDNFTFTPLSRHEGKVRVCAETLCCYLNYKKTFPPSELYAFGVFDGLHTVHGNYSLQICAVVKCGGPEPKTCGHEVTDASSVINFELWGNFSTRRIYPLLLTSGVTLDLPDYWGWKGNHCHMHKNNMSSGLVTGALYGRFYERD
ncbi:biotinidase-like [Discoglossus pictus]